MTEQITHLSDESIMGYKAKLMTKMASVISKSHTVTKKGKNEKQQYKFAQHSDIIEELRKTIAEEKIYILPRPRNFSSVDIISSTGNKGVMVTTHMDFNITDLETGYTETVSWFGQGMDYGDKAMYKSYTGALKYFLLDTFMISTGDDPEKDKTDIDLGSVKPKTTYPRQNQPSKYSRTIFARPEQIIRIKELADKNGRAIEDIAKENKVFKLAGLTLIQADQIIKQLETGPDLGKNNEKVDPDIVQKGLEEEKVYTQPVKRVVNLQIAWIKQNSLELVRAGLLSSADESHLEEMTEDQYNSIRTAFKNLKGNGDVVNN